MDMSRGLFVQRRLQDETNARSCNLVKITTITAIHQRCKEKASAIHHLLCWITLHSCITYNQFLFFDICCCCCYCHYFQLVVEINAVWSRSAYVAYRVSACFILSQANRFGWCNMNEATFVLEVSQTSRTTTAQQICAQKKESGKQRITVHIPLVSRRSRFVVLCMPHNLI